jgi:hypothetical protein
VPMPGEVIDGEAPFEEPTKVAQGDDIGQVGLALVWDPVGPGVYTEARPCQLVVAFAPGSHPGALLVRWTHCCP